MQDLFSSFNVSQVQDEKKNPASNGTYALIPHGTEVWLELEESEIKPTKANNGQCAHLVWKCVSEEGKGKKIWDYIVVAHENKTAENIGQQKLKDIVLGMGLQSFNRIEELQGQRVRAKIKVERSEQYGDSNKVHYYISKAESAKKNNEAAHAAIIPGLTEREIPSKPMDDYDDDIDAIFS